MRRVPIPRLAAIAIAASGAIFAGGAFSDAATKHRHKPPPCSLPGSKTLYSDTAVRIFEKSFPRGSPPYFPPGGELRIYACQFRTNKRTRIASSNDSDAAYVAYLAVQGPRIAYWDYAISKYGEEPYSHVCVLDLRRRSSPRCTDAGYYVQGLGVTRAGSVAWMDAPKVENPTYFVHKLDAGTTTPTLLDSAQDIDPTSLAVGGSHIYWIKAGAPQHATMP
jgi:hypothetical protein